MITNENRRILIVDDEPKNLKILKIRLGDEYELLEAGSGEEALELVEDFQPAVILLDIMMDGIDGYEVAEKIKENRKTRDVKVILVSGKARIDEKLRGYQVGAEEYITKPFNGEELKAKIKVYMSLYNLESQLKRVNQSLEGEVQVRCEQLLKSERLAFIGMRTGEIVHNLKNPLAIIKGFTQLLKRKGIHEREINGIDDAADKILEIVKNILNSMGVERELEIQVSSVCKVVEEELKFLKIDADFKDNVKVELDLKGSDHISISSVTFSQIIGNLIKNATEAMRGLEERKITIRSEDIGDLVLVSVGDTGLGISEENLARICEPLFTTKDGADGGPVGNGLGLSYCQKMVEAFGGTLKIESELGKGTNVLVRLPKADDVNVGVAA